MDHSSDDEATNELAKDGTRKNSLGITVSPFGSGELVRAKSKGSSSTYSGNSGVPNNNNNNNSNNSDKTLKQKKKDYSREMKSRHQQSIYALQEPSAIILSGWLKIRGTLKNWPKYWCVLLPGVLVYYKDELKSEWQGSLLLSGCEIIERPTKKEGFCFKIYHPLCHPIYSSKGPKGEVLPAIFLPIANDHGIFRTYSENEGRQWMNAARRAISSGINSDVNSINSEAKEQAQTPTKGGSSTPLSGSNNFLEGDDPSTSLDENMAFRRPDDDDDESISDYEMADSTPPAISVSQCTHTPYVQEVEVIPNLTAGETKEEWGQESRSLILTLLKQVKIGMDLSKIVLPTFILEPRSFLDKLSDYFYHVDILAGAAKQPDPELRMLEVVKWFISGFYKKPNGVKKPYNPILGEVFRCCWQHPNGSWTHYVSEQVSHHPPISAFFVGNKKEGFRINGTILSKSKLYPASAASILDGCVFLTFPELDEVYRITLPTAYAKGYILGTLLLEMGDNVHITCEKSGYETLLEFKLKPMFGGEYNVIRGKMKHGNEVRYSFQGYWDQRLDMCYGEPAKDSSWNSLWSVSESTWRRRLPRFVVPSQDQGCKESERMWRKVTEAIGRGDQQGATEEKFVLEEQQRGLHKEMKQKGLAWCPRLFEKRADQYVYLHTDHFAASSFAADSASQYEFQGVITAGDLPRYLAASVDLDNPSYGMQEGTLERPEVLRSALLEELSRSAVDRKGSTSDEGGPLTPPPPSDSQLHQQRGSVASSASASGSGGLSPQPRSQKGEGASGSKEARGAMSGSGSAVAATSSSSSSSRLLSQMDALRAEHQEMSSRMVSLERRVEAMSSKLSLLPSSPSPSSSAAATGLLSRDKIAIVVCVLAIQFMFHLMSATHEQAPK